MNGSIEFIQRLEIDYLKLVIKYKNDQIKMLWQGIGVMSLSIAVLYLAILLGVAK